MRYLVECLGHRAFILVIHIAYNIILICLTGDCSIYKLKLGDPFKTHDLATYLQLPVDFYTPINVTWIYLFVLQTPDILGLR